MRLDIFLKISGLVKRRSLAKTLCDEGAVLINRQPAKGGKLLKIGDIVEIDLWNRHLLIEVLEIPEKKSMKKDDPPLYKVLEEQRKSKRIEW
ncbi:MAG: RNA-binding S4 domain-containing protein [Candidatus Tectomicrobia bacterium]|nr:RNA-binding S4 domain-containing protein [Candidatus Tectomicrobia bacterium]